MENVTNKNDNTYHLGLAMAGAVSAGAYTAGVLDYLFETLERWEKEKATGRDDVPSHNVVLDVMGGASAGGMCAAIAPLQYIAGDDVLNTSLLKDLWVNIVGGQADMFSELLMTGDIKDDELAFSLLNSNCIDELGERIQRRLFKNFDEVNTPALPAYISNNLEILLTLFNVSGLKFKMEISNMRRAKQQFAFEHRDLAHFRWSNKYRDDGRIPTWQDRDALHTYVQAAKATGAFPIGLSARKVKRKIRHIRDNEFIAGNAGDNLIFDGGDKQLNYESMNADGGTANNEPLEYVRCIIKKTLENEGRTGPGNAGVILVDPFPAFDKKIVNQADPDKSLKSYAGKLLEAMRSQLLFDAKNMVAEYRKADKNSFMIAPAKKSIDPDKVLACGGLGGFSGFISKEYREHDYQLGRRNCQQFLRFYFVVKPGEAAGSAVVQGYNAKAIERFAVINTPVIDGVMVQKIYLPIIPDTFNCNDIQARQPEQPYELKLPDKNYLLNYRPMLRKRLQYVFRRLLPVRWWYMLPYYAIADIAAWLLARLAIKTIYKSLKERGVIK